VTLDIESVTTCLETARRECLMSWNDAAGDSERDPELALHMVTALLNLELAIIAIEREKFLTLTVKKARLEAERARLRSENADEPSVGDVAEASDVHATAAAEADGIRELANALQSKARPQ
jgi:hypothetical protein